LQRANKAIIALVFAKPRTGGEMSEDRPSIEVIDDAVQDRSLSVTRAPTTVGCVPQTQLV
jgi:hypothetical protein